MPKSAKTAQRPSKRPIRRGTAKRASPATISAWQDDPASGLDVISRPVPDLSKGPLKYRIKGAAVPPGVYAKGTPQFRYWTAAEALRRGGDFWSPLLGVAQWQPGRGAGRKPGQGRRSERVLRSNRAGFFHQTLGQVTYYSGESPDVVCHEMGHACLDAHRPELFDAPFIEAGAFHESFGDMSAILSALQLPSVRAAVLAGVKGYKSTQLSRCAEQLGEAIRQVKDGRRFRLSSQRVQRVQIRRSADVARQRSSHQAVRRGAFLLENFHRCLLRNSVRDAENPLQEPDAG